MLGSTTVRDSVASHPRQFGICGNTHSQLGTLSPAGPPLLLAAVRVSYTKT